VFQELYEMRGRGFARLNRALLTLIPKQVGANTLRDYRPISLIHSITKLFAKVLSQLLAPKLDSLVSPIQSAFISSQSLHDNFVLVRESARMLHRLGEPRLLLKLDLARAFDSLSWPFLFEALRHYGFGDRFLEWLAILLSSASMQVLLNGKPGPVIWHRRGLRQGEPLSPQLFDLAVDTLGRLFKHATELGILRQLHPVALPLCRRRNHVCQAQAGDIKVVQRVLELFGHASGLHINYTKSTATLIRCDPNEVTPMVVQLGCLVVALPLTYLGIPLTIRKPTAA
jgi:hypothetical protein